MTAKANRVGQRFKHCTVIREAGRDKKQNVLWECLCDCGKSFTARGYDLTSGKIISCKCAVKAPIKHGKGRGKGRRSKIYSVWATMIARCTNSKDRNYSRYGGRGITVTEEWKKFENFYKDMGDPPFIGATLDRADNNAGYSKNNCRWVTSKEQARNTQSNVRVTYNGQTKVLADWFDELSISRGAYYYYIKHYGLSRADALRRAYDRRRVR